MFEVTPGTVYCETFEPEEKNLKRLFAVSADSNKGRISTIGFDIRKKSINC